MTSLWTRFQFGKLCASLNHPVSNSMNTSGCFIRGIKRPGLEADHSPPTSDEIKNEWSYASTTPTQLHGVYRDNFSCSYLLYYHHWRFKSYTDMWKKLCVVKHIQFFPSFTHTKGMTHFLVHRYIPWNLPVNGSCQKVIFLQPYLQCYAVYSENGSHTLIRTSGACNSSFVRGCFWILEQYCTWCFRDYQVQHMEFEDTR